MHGAQTRKDLPPRKRGTVEDAIYRMFNGPPEHTPVSRRPKSKEEKLLERVVQRLAGELDATNTRVKELEERIKSLSPAKS